MNRPTAPAPGVDAGRIARDHAGVLPSAGELHVAGGGPARGKLDGEPDAPAVRRPAPFEAGGGAGGREPAGDLVAPRGRRPNTGMRQLLDRLRDEKDINLSRWVQRQVRTRVSGP